MSSISDGIERGWRVTRPIARAAAMVVLELATTVRAAATVVAVEVLVRTMPLPRLGRLLGCRVDISSAPASGVRLASWELSRRHRRRLRCAHRVAGVWPFSDGPCLRRALVGGHLVRELNPSVRLGLAVADAELEPHAWLEFDGRPLEDIEQYAPFATVVHGRVS